MIEAVQRRIEKNAKEILTPREIQEFETPQEVHQYVGETDEGPVTAVRTQHRIRGDGSGGGFKIVEVGADMPVDEMLRLNRAHSLGLATLMSLKGGLFELDLPGGHGNDFGGAKGEMFVPKGTLPTADNPSREKIDAILEAYVRAQAEKGAIKLGNDRHAPDMNTGPADMDLMANTLVNYTGDERARAAFSGKSLEAYGLAGREIATSQGLVFMLENQLQLLERDPQKTTVAVQGSGNVGYHFARLATEQLGVKILGISDRFVAVEGTADAPIIVDETVKFENRAIAAWNEDVHRVSTRPDDLLEMDVDVLVFAAAPDTITKEKNNKHVVKAPILLQGANSPFDEDAFRYYLKQGKFLTADIDANKAGLVGSNIEYNQGMTGSLWTERMVIGALKNVMDTSFKKVLAEADDEHNLVDPAFRVAIKSEYEKDHSGLFVPSR